MKVIIYSIFLTLLISNAQHLKAQTNYEAKMLDAQQKLTYSKTEADYSNASRLYSEIANSQKTNWLPYYYAGLCKCLAAITLKTKKTDLLCNEADFFIYKCDSLSKNNAEIYVLKSLNFSARLSVNPAARAMKYNKQIHQANEMAMKLDNTNPRVHLQKAQSVYYTPESFGGGAKKALPLYEIAFQKFKAYKVDNTIMPQWGKDITEKMIEECKLKLTKSNKK
jgi:hypothetical protein